MRKKIINAGGPWVDDVRELDGSKKRKNTSFNKRCPSSI